MTDRYVGKELRIGLVLYGGVSLAVYMNGIVTELWHALRASQRRQSADEGGLGGTAGVYAELLDRLASAPDGRDLRIVVDAVAGTSAGGVNGAALAKAVVEGADATALNRVWIDQADIAKLRTVAPTRAPFLLRSALLLSSRVRAVKRLVDELPGITWEWARDSLYSMLKAADGSVTPLDGRYFSRMIAGTFRDMGRGAPALLPTRGTFDLFLTRTDLHGWPRHLPVGRTFHPDDLYERTHAHVMTFRCRPTGTSIGDDFDLTYAARTTAGFPLAFAPVGFDEVAACYREARPGETVPTANAFAGRHLREHELAGFPARLARMADGGLLDNKPFSHVAKAIENKPADHEVYRILMFVEPDPESEIALPPNPVPSAFAVMKNLFGVFRHEPILADLSALGERNARVEVLREMRRSALADVCRTAERAGAAANLAWPPDPAHLELWSAAMNRRAAADPSPGYGGYVAIKARRAAALLAETLCAALRYPYPSRHGYLVRAVTRAWLGRRGALGTPAYVDGDGFVLDAAQSTLLRAFDLAYRQRRIRTLVQAVNSHYGTSPAAVTARDWRASLDAAKATFADVAFAFEAAFLDTDGIEVAVREAFASMPEGQVDDEIATAKNRPGDLAEQYDSVFGGLYDGLVARLTAHGEEQNARLFEAVAVLPEPARGDVVSTLVTFPLLDATLFPLMDLAGVEDLVTVDTMRVSPRDATFVSDDPKRLRGWKLGAFAGFLERSAREHDLMWGRLDGAERLIELILAASGLSGQAGSNLRQEFTRRAMLAALAEEEIRPGTSVAGEASRVRAALGGG